MYDLADSVQISTELLFWQWDLKGFKHSCLREDPETY